MSLTEQDPLTWLDGEKIIPLATPARSSEISVREITSLSPDSIKRHYAKFVVQLSPHRLGMKMKHALAIAAGKAP